MSISHEEKYEVDIKIILSSDNNNIARIPSHFDAYILANNTSKTSGLSWEAIEESSLVIQLSLIADIEQL